MFKQNLFENTLKLIDSKTKVEINIFKKLKAVKDVFLKSKSRIPQGKIPEAKPDIDHFMKKDNQTKFIWFGHSTLLVNIDGQIILMDPIFSRYASPIYFIVKRFQPPVLNLNELPHIDTILISHNHYDHLDKKTIKFFKRNSTEFIVPLGIGNILERWGIDRSRITELDWYESADKNPVKYTSAPAKHFSGRGLFDRNKTNWSSWVIEGKNEKIFFSGDSGYGKHFKEINKYFGKFDIVFIENGQYDKRWPDIHMMPEKTVQAALDLEAKNFVPIHWGMFCISFHHWAEPIERSSRLAKKKGLQVADY